MKISKLFHYLYAALCFLPLLVIPAFMLAVRSDNNFQPITIQYDKRVQHINYKYESNEVTGFSDLVSGNIYEYTNFSFSDTETTEFIINIIHYDNLNEFNYSNENVEEFYIDEPFDILTGIFSLEYFGDGTGYLTITNNYCYTSYALEISSFDANKVVFIYDEDFEEYISVTGNLPQYTNYNIIESITNDGELVTFNDTDIGSQLLYTCYLTTDKYMNFDEVLNLGAISDWIETNVFNNNVPLIWTIIWHYLDYWLLLSIFWLCFDVLIYVPQLAHRWLDKASLE